MIPTQVDKIEDQRDGSHVVQEGVSSPDKGAIRRLVSTTSGPRILGTIYHKLIWFPSIAWYLRKELRDCSSILDLGCGSNSTPRYFPRTFFANGVEAWKNSTTESKRKHMHDEYVLADITSLELSEESVDAVLLHEVLEHLTKDDGKSLVKKMSGVARRRIILTTPNGFIPQWDETYPLQMHKSEWEKSDLEKVGSTEFRRCGGLEPLGRKFDLDKSSSRLSRASPRKWLSFLPSGPMDRYAGR